MQVDEVSIAQVHRSNDGMEVACCFVGRWGIESRKVVLGKQSSAAPKGRLVHAALVTVPVVREVLGSPAGQGTEIAKSTISDVFDV